MQVEWTGLHHLFSAARVSHLCEDHAGPGFGELADLKGIEKTVRLQ